MALPTEEELETNRRAIQEWFVQHKDLPAEEQVALFMKEVKIIAHVLCSICHRVFVNGVHPEGQYSDECLVAEILES